MQLKAYGVPEPPAAPAAKPQQEQRGGLGLALVLVASSEDPAATEAVVEDVVPGGAAALSGEVAAGDVMLAVDGKGLLGLSLDDVKRMVVGRAVGASTCDPIRAVRSSHAKEQGASHRLDQAASHAKDQAAFFVTGYDRTLLHYPTMFSRGRNRQDFVCPFCS